MKARLRLIHALITVEGRIAHGTRLKLGSGQTVIIYDSGTVVVQGKGAQGLRKFLLGEHFR